MMQGNLRKAVDADGNHSTSHSGRGVAYHLTIIPCPSTHMPWQHRTKGDWNRPGQADLPTVGMATYAQPDLREKFARLRLDKVAGAPEELAIVIKSEIVKWPRSSRTQG